MKIHFYYKDFPPPPPRLLKEVIELDQSLFPLPWSKGSWHNLNPERHFLSVILENNQTLGFLLMQLIPESGEAHLLKIFTLPLERRQRRAKKMWLDTLALLQQEGFERVFWELQEENQAGESFYQSMGAKLLTRQRDYYGSGRNALLFEYPLS